MSRSQDNLQCGIPESNLFALLDEVDGRTIGLKIDPVHFRDLRSCLQQAHLSFVQMEEKIVFGMDMIDTEDMIKVCMRIDQQGWL